MIIEWARNYCISFSSNLCHSYAPNAFERVGDYLFMRLSDSIARQGDFLLLITAFREGLCRAF